jgi:hypothetical protein
MDVHNSQRLFHIHSTFLLSNGLYDLVHAFLAIETVPEIHVEPDLSLIPPASRYRIGTRIDKSILSFFFV